MSKRETMVRYGRLNGTRTPKNTLVTLRDGDTVYFGVARCRRGDTFKKTRGTQIALSRAQLAFSEGSSVLDTEDDGLELHESGLRGAAHVSQIRSLLTYFDDVEAQRQHEDTLEDVE